VSAAIDEAFQSMIARGEGHALIQHMTLALLQWLQQRPFLACPGGQKLELLRRSG